MWLKGQHAEARCVKCFQVEYARGTVIYLSTERHSGSNEVPDDDG
jgi:hypothetical protein